VGLSVACALGVLDGLSACNATRNVSLKWPNDLLVDGRKLGGILLEAEEDFVVCGIGINLVAPEGIKAALDEPLGALKPACLEDALNGRPTPNFEVLANSVRTGIINRTEIWEHAMGDPVEPLAPMRKEYLSRLAYLNRQVRAVSPEGTDICKGCFTDVDGWGRAILTLQNGEIRRFSCEQASLRVI
jgi:BirA family biotin operon repressor/biotin-[acetyl-CoA-carboxylase] ligase